jgi:hypothetical protein
MHLSEVFIHADAILKVSEQADLVEQLKHHSIFKAQAPDL